MAHYYNKKDIKKIADNMVIDMMTDIVNGGETDQKEISSSVIHIRLFQRFVEKIIEKIDETDTAYEAEMAKFRQQKEEQDGTAS